MRKKSCLIGFLVALSFALVSVWLSGCSSDGGVLPVVPENSVFSQASVADSGECDVSYRGTIESINYAALFLTVEEKPEVVLVDDVTEIWTMVTKNHSSSLGEVKDYGEKDKCFRGKEDHYVALEFSDLAIGAIIEVRANFVTPDTLLAVKIKLTNYCEETCVTFEDVITSIDYVTRTLTFSYQDWTGVVCPNARLVDTNGDPLPLEDFAVNDAVAVRGFPLEEGILRICELTLQAL